MTALIQPIDNLRGPAGHLEALLNLPADNTNPTFAAVVCHPHPPSGGTMHTKVVYHAMKTLTSLGVPTLRFNFRSVGLSDGLYDHGHGEREDVTAAINWLDSHLHLPILFAGFSFGAAVGLHACVSTATGEPDSRVKALIALGLPIRTNHRSYDYTFLAKATQPKLLPKLLLSGDHDQFAPRPLLEAIAATLPEPKSLQLIPNADHFFNPIPPATQTQIPAMQAALAAWLRQTFPAEFPAADPSA